MRPVRWRDQWLWMLALVRLIQVHRATKQGFRQICGEFTRATPTLRSRSVDVRAVTAAVDRAVAWYPRLSTCFQRSAVLVSLLRSGGVEAELILGIRVEPYKGHAWVEVNRVVVNDVPSVQTDYVAVDRL